MAHNYISRLDIACGTLHTYHSNTIIFNNEYLSDLLVPGLLHQLIIRSNYPEMFKNIVSAPSRYDLPSYIISDKLTEELRSVLARSLVFIHTWFKDHPQSNSDPLDSSYESYSDFFTEILSFIINNEHDPQIRDIAVDLKQSIRKISQYLGSYHGNLNHIVHPTSNIMSTIMITFLYSINTMF
jgi:hypothetical protein